MSDQMSKIMMATDNADVAQLAMIEAVRQIGDNGKATNKLLEGMQTELRDVRERVIRIEASEYKNTIIKVDARVDDLDERVVKLEADKHRRDGALNLVEWFGRNWPAMIGFAGLIGLLLATGRLSI